MIQKVSGKDPITLTLVLQNLGGGWKLAGYYPRLDSVGGHDGEWYLAKAREYKAKGYSHDAWFYYLTAWDLTAPVNFMSTPQLDKIADEMQTARPTDLPSDGSPLSFRPMARPSRLPNSRPCRSTAIWTCEFATRIPMPEIPQ